MGRGGLERVECWGGLLVFCFHSPTTLRKSSAADPKWILACEAAANTQQRYLFTRRHAGSERRNVSSVKQFNRNISFYDCLILGFTVLILVFFILLSAFRHRHEHLLQCNQHLSINDYVFTAKFFL